LVAVKNSDSHTQLCCENSYNRSAFVKAIAAPDFELLTKSLFRNAFIQSIMFPLNAFNAFNAFLEAICN
jgi:hypothetical protein